MSVKSFISVAVLAAISDSVVSTASAQTRVDELLCVQTSNFVYDNGAGVQRPATITSSFPVQTSLSFQGRRRGYVYYQSGSILTSAGAQNNPYFNNSGNPGEMPLDGFRFVVVNPIANASPGVDDAGLYVGDGSAAFPDLWEGMQFRIDFLNDAMQVGLSYVAEGRIILTSSTSGTALLPDVTNTYTFSTLGGPLRLMTPTVFGGGSPPVGSLYLQDITFTTTIVPAPGTAVLLGLAGLAAARRRR